MQRLEVSGAVRPIYESLGVKRSRDTQYLVHVLQHVCMTWMVMKTEITEFYPRDELFEGGSSNFDTVSLHVSTGICLSFSTANFDLTEPLFEICSS